MMSKRDALQRRLESFAAAESFRLFMEKEVSKRPLSAANTLVDMLMRIVKQSVLEGMEKDDLLAIVGKFYDDYLSSIDIPGKFDKVIHGMVRSVVLELVSVGIDSIRAKLQPT